VSDDGATLNVAGVATISERGITTLQPTQGWSEGPTVTRAAGLGERATTGSSSEALTTSTPLQQVAAAALSASPVLLPLASSVVLRGNIRTELVMLNKLGAGASCIVQRALHLPSLQVRGRIESSCYCRCGGG
jgi:hypothetical protein